MALRDVLGSLVLGSVLLACPSSLAQEVGPEWSSDGTWEAVDLVIALDTSTSMDDLLDSARGSLWDVVNELETAQPRPALRVALIAYGSPAYDSRNGWVRIATGFTSDLDLVSQRLFELKAGGGQEYVASAVRAAVADLDWTPSDDALKLLFVAGNEPADQDPRLDLRDAAMLAAREGISLTAIYCGNPQDGPAQSWQELAEWADGHFAAIARRRARGVADVAITPFDQKLVELGTALNETFVPLGDSGRERFQALVRQDAQVLRASPAAAAARVRTKALPGYGAGWDVVSALAGGARIDEVPEEELPEQLAGMRPEERAAVLQELLARRNELRHRIEELTAQRRTHLLEQAGSSGTDAPPTFAGTVREVIRTEALDRGFKLPVQ